MRTCGCNVVGNSVDEMVNCKYNASVTLRYALYTLLVAHAVAECILRRGGSDALFPNDFGEDFIFIFAYVLYQV